MADDVNDDVTLDDGVTDDEECIAIDGNEVDCSTIRRDFRSLKYVVITVLDSKVVCSPAVLLCSLFDVEGSIKLCKGLRF